MMLASVPVSATVRVTGVRTGGPSSCRLMEMGLIEGALVQVVGRAPLGDPMRVKLGDYELSLRASEADLVDVASI
jgi:Fe2+ transport system protein FeoA